MLTFCLSVLSVDILSRGRETSKAAGGKLRVPKIGLSQYSGTQYVFLGLEKAVRLVGTALDFVV